MKNHLLIFVLLIISTACSSSPVGESDNLNTTPLATTRQDSNLQTEEVASPSPNNTPTDTAMPSETSSSAPPTLPDYKDFIVFVSERDGDDEIYLLDPETNTTEKLTDNNDTDSYPRWSHDKIRILYLSRISPKTYLFVMNPDGSEKINLTPDSSRINQCEWSPTSYLIACTRPREDLSGDNLIIVDSIDESISIAYMSPGNIFDIAWSPDGNNIAMAPNDYDGLRIYNITNDTVNEYELGDGFPQKVAWSNNGNRLAYSFGPAIQGDFATVHTVKADGRNPRRWVEIGGPEWVQAFSAGDEYVLLESARDGLFEIFVFDLESKELIQLTDNEVDDTRSTHANYSPVYSADGSKIVFVSVRDGNSEIYMMNADGTDQTNLTNDQARDWNPDW